MLNNENQQAIDALKEVAMAGIKEQRSSRRWGIFFKILSLLVLLLFIGAMAGAIAGKNKRISATADYTAVVDVQGYDGAAAT